MENLLGHIAEHTGGDDIVPLIRLVNRLRPERSKDISQAGNNVLALTYLLEHDARLRKGLREYISALFTSRKQVHLYSDIGILDNVGFASATIRRLVWRFLPPAVNDQYMKDVFGQVFYRRDDYIWIQGIDDAIWHRLLDALFADATDDTALLQGAQHQILSSLQVLSHRITAIGLEPELVRNYPAIEQFESPFLRQNEEIVAYVNEYRRWLAGDLPAHMDEKQCGVLLHQCREVIDRIEKHASKNGISVSLTYLLQRVSQSIARVETLFRLLQSEAAPRRLESIRFFKELVREDNRKYSLRELYSKNTELIALQVTGNAGKTGEHYVTADRKGYLEMLRSAMGAGFIIAFMGLFKILFARMKLALIGQAFFYSLNYSLGFMFIHIVHFTVATKQPAMTASKIASSFNLGGAGNKEKREAIQNLADLTVNVFRTQFIAILGNIIVVFPLAYLLAVFFNQYAGHQLASTEKAEHLLAELNIVASPAVFHAAIAGVFLFLSGLISGYYDNKAVYNRIPERIRQLRWLQRLLGTERLLRMTVYLEYNLGALAGNFFFGVFLGSTAALGVILGLPLDIRHVTFSAANFAYALVAFNNQVPWQVVVMSVTGILAIGLTNLLVSFGLALMVALKAQGVQYRQWVPLALLVGRRFMKSPLQFFWPSKEIAGKTDIVNLT